MRRVAVGIIVGTLALSAWVGWISPFREAQAQQPGAASVGVPGVNAPGVHPLMVSEGLIALSSDTADGRQQVAVIDSKARVISVYHIEHKTGVITLKSVRDITADLMMDEFNTESPLPREIRAILIKR